MKINLNSPDGNVFQLLGIISGLLKKANMPVEEFNTALSRYNTYDDIVKYCKEVCKQITEKTGEEITIYKSKEYEMV